MWIIEFLPEWVFHLTLLIGVLGTLVGLFLGMIPFVKQYQIVIQLISIILLVFGVYTEGAVSDNNAWEQKVSELKVKLAKAETQASQVNTEIVTKVLTQKQIVKVKGDTVIQYIDREVKKNDSTCTIAESTIKAHNAGAQNIAIDSNPVSTTDHNSAASPMKLPKK